MGFIASCRYGIGEKLRDDVIGRVSFANCDPLFHELGGHWRILPAPPSWLTGHLLRGECLIAPIPLADFVKNIDSLQAIDSIGIASDGGVGSVLLFGNRPIEEMRDIAVPTDSSTSRTLLPWLLSRLGRKPRLIEMGPDLESMLNRCDGALIIGDRAIDEADINPNLIRMDLGAEWLNQTGLPMVFGVFCARKDADSEAIKRAVSALEENLDRFENDELHRLRVIEASSDRTRFSIERISHYFQSEVRNRLKEKDRESMTLFAEQVCGFEESVPWWDDNHDSSSNSEPVSRRRASS